jgi:hypothetical protein
VGSSVTGEDSDGLQQHWLTAVHAQTHARRPGSWQCLVRLVRSLGADRLNGVSVQPQYPEHSSALPRNVGVSKHGMRPSERARARRAYPSFETGVIRH